MAAVGRKETAIPQAAGVEVPLHLSSLPIANAQGGTSSESLRSRSKKPALASSHHLTPAADPAIVRVWSTVRSERRQPL